MPDLPEPECTHGYTRAQIATIVPDVPAFNRWMFGQTMTLCEGRRFNHDTREYEPSECAANPHGAVVYPWDLQRFLDGRPIVD